MANKPVIYISSTFFDLQEHRRELIDALRSTELFDVRGMENYGTVSQPPLKKCLQDVEESEFYVLLLGKRYGYIPDGYNLSITNLEYKQAIGDADMTRVAGKPAQNNRCVLPFIIEDSYTYDASIQIAMDDERKREGEDISLEKDKKLAELKNQIRKDFVVDKGFSTPDDLVAKVQGAIMPELVRRNYASTVSKMLIHEETVYRCDRVKPREEFLLKNSRLFRVFVIHGERSELPEIFSNNISHYDLNIDKQIEIKNLDEYTSSVPAKFLSSMAFTFYQRIYAAYPETDDFNFEQLAEKLIADPAFNNMVIRIEISFQSWTKYYQLIDALFTEMNRVKPLLSGEKNLYLILIVKYKTPDSDLQENPAAAAVLDKLRSLKLYDIEEWVSTYFYMNKSITDNNRKDFLVREVIQYYFKDYYESEESFSMEDAIKRLSNVVNDFNNNANLFENYQNLYNKQ